MPVTTFRLPPGTLTQQLDHCLRIIRLQREELLPLRGKLNTCHLNKSNAEKSVDHWKEKYHQAEEEIKKLKEEKKQWEQEKEKLKEAIEKLTKTNKRYQVSLFDHGNFKNLQEGDKKKKGDDGLPVRDRPAR